MIYDVLLVGCGLSAATIAALLKNRYKILALDTRPHIAGNCYDYYTNNTYVHVYGPHIFHTNNKQIETFVKQYSTWLPHTHYAQAQVLHNNQLQTLPFPYSDEVDSLLGHSLTDQQIINTYFEGYTQKMWGMKWNEIPQSVRNRIPKKMEGQSQYFKGEFCGLPEFGYIKMIEKMFMGVDVLLGVAPDLWKSIPAKHIIYCGRPDSILPNKKLRYRSLKIDHVLEPCELGIVSVTSYPHMQTSYTRRTNYNVLYKREGLFSDFISYETPYEAESLEVAPFYPNCELDEIAKAKQIMQEAKAIYPNIHFLGRLGTYKYLNMDQVIGQAMALAETL